MPVLLNAADRPLFLGSRPTPFPGADGYPAVWSRCARESRRGPHPVPRFRDVVPRRRPRRRNPAPLPPRRARLHAPYFKPLEELAEAGRRVVVYDQLGCGSSDRPDDPDLWTVELFVDEVRTVREALDLDRIHLLGTSWGSMLAIEYVLTHPQGSSA